MAISIYNNARSASNSQKQTNKLRWGWCHPTIEISYLRCTIVICLLRLTELKQQRSCEVDYKDINSIVSFIWGERHR
jgi:hypothetical protein